MLKSSSIPFLGKMTPAKGSMAIAALAIFSSIFYFHVVSPILNGNQSSTVCLDDTCLTNYAGQVIAEAAIQFSQYLYVCQDPTFIARSRCYFQSSSSQNQDLSSIVGATWHSLCQGDATCDARHQNGQLDDAFFADTILSFVDFALPAVPTVGDVWSMVAKDTNDWQTVAPSEVPLQGDIAVWQTSNIGDGHVAFVVSKNNDTGLTLTGADNPSVTFNAVRQSSGQLNSDINGTLQGYIRVHPSKTKSFGPVINSAKYPDATQRSHAFFCTALPFARLAYQWMTTKLAKPFSTLNANPAVASHPWYVSVILAQWSVETGLTMPTYTGYNFGNVSGLFPGEPTIGGTSAPGSPNSFAFALTPLDGVRYYVTFIQTGLYDAATQAYGQGSEAQAVALGGTGWDAQFYDPDATPGVKSSDHNPGGALLDRITVYHLKQFDNGSSGYCA